MNDDEQSTHGGASALENHRFTYRYLYLDFYECLSVFVELFAAKKFFYKQKNFRVHLMVWF